MPYLHIPNVSVKARFATENGLRYRYRLEITKACAPSGMKTACVVMQNPSYAGETIADKSVQFMEKNVFERGLPEFAQVGRLIVVNQFAFIQTNAFQGLAHENGSKNDRAITDAIIESDIVIIAWGKSNRFEQRKEFVMNVLRSASPAKTLYMTRMHPSRGRYEGFIQPLSISNALPAADSR
ncbi:MAG TPA: DUF1643 domain-containing protein [Bacteroidota bacterium]|nr:DUF1643 domain-containing protein [Bacteroidota bacterium]